MWWPAWCVLVAAAAGAVWAAATGTLVACTSAQALPLPAWTDPRTACVYVLVALVTAAAAAAEGGRWTRRAALCAAYALTFEQAWYLVAALLRELVWDHACLPPGGEGGRSNSVSGHALLYVYFVLAVWRPRLQRWAWPLLVLRATYTLMAALVLYATFAGGYETNPI
eukprot:TRINITY_DN4862_c0_g1_i1.p2 TRINITY_DN4862_c0_g1~~TRINITY_DN4862_c0_g1_i1.p2  ORF type:complete len:168 (+),score=40.17 TRINITY_DN4862_c0_g1_i1:184-687(+)